MASLERPLASLERLLDGLDVTAGPLALHDVRRNGALDSARFDGPIVHYAMRGAGVLELTDGDGVSFAAHDVIVTPARRRARIVLGDDTVVACFGIRATYRGSVGVFDNLREPLVEKLGPDDPLCRSLEEFLDEVAGQRPGSRAMADTLVRRCLILLLRRHFQHGAWGRAWLTVLEDTRLGRAITAMYDCPEHAFTLPELAEVAGMSRTVFAARFVDALAQPPIEFLKRLRLRRAAQLLSGTDLPVKAVAAQVGYASRSSFTRAFIACHGAAPTAFRAAAALPGPDSGDGLLKLVSVRHAPPGARRGGQAA